MQVYYFQFVCDGINLPLEMEAEPDTAIYELVNYGARAYDEVEDEYTAMEDSSVNEISIKFGDEAAGQEADDNLINVGMSNTEDYVLDVIISKCRRELFSALGTMGYGYPSLRREKILALYMHMMVSSTRI